MQSGQVSAEFESKFVDIKGEVTLKSLPSDWLILYLEVVSDMTSDELTQVGKKEPDNISKLMMLDTQVALNQKFPSSCRVKDIMMRVLRKLSAEAGSRLANFKALGGLMADGDLNLKEVGCFTPSWSDERSINPGKLDTLRHNQSMTVKTPSAASQ